MRKLAVSILFITIAAIVLSPLTRAAENAEKSPEAMEQVLLRLLFDPAYKAIEEYYGEPRQYWNEKLLSVRPVPETSYYEVVLQVETFCGAHNPPYGIETMTFYILYGHVELHHFEHQDEENKTDFFCVNPDWS